MYEATGVGSTVVTDVGGPNGGAGFKGVTGGRGLTGGPLYPGKDYRTTPGMDIFMDNENGCNFFFKNNGDGTYSEVASQLGITDCSQNGRGVALMEANGDDSMDIVYGNWNGPHRMYVSDVEGSKFENVANGGNFPQLGDSSLIRTVIVADFDNDGYPEIFWNNIPSYQAEQPNKLFRTTDGKKWALVDIGAALEPMGYGTGAGVADFDGDGILELLVAHGESATQPLSLFKINPIAEGGIGEAAKKNNYLRLVQS